MDATPDRRLAWEACYNARDLGGLAMEDGVRTASGRIFRADNLCRLTPGGRESLVRSGVRTIIDLRSPFELELDPCPFAAARTSNAVRGYPTYLHVPLLDETDALREALDAAPTVAAMYALMLDRCATGVGAVFAAITSAPPG